LINADDWNWHDVSVAKFVFPQKKNVAQWVIKGAFDTAPMQHRGNRSADHQIGSNRQKSPSGRIGVRRSGDGVKLRPP
jgi:hypothetical protein